MPTRTALKVLFLLALLAGAYGIGRWHAGGTRTADRQATAPKVLYYVCPMHPQYRSDKPGISPCCGMRLEPVYAGGASPAVTDRAAAGAVQISPEKRQLIGVRLATAEAVDGTETLRAFGRIAYDDQESIVIADLLENQATRVKVGLAGLVSVPFHPEQNFWAKVNYVYPRLDAVTRTLKVRLEAAETGFKLLPDTFVNVDFRIPGERALAVPAEAVMNSGLRQTVFVDLGDGYLGPRQVETGRRLGDRIEIRRGLQRGERVVVSGNFLIDSESRMKLAASGVPATESAPDRDPVCGMEVAPAKAAGHSEYRGQTYTFCSRECKAKFDGSPAKYARQTEAPWPVAAKPFQAARAAENPAMAEEPQENLEGTPATPPPAAPVFAQRGATVHIDPVCGKAVQEKNAYRRTMLYRDIALYFCSEECFREFGRNPEFYGQKAVPTVILRKPGTEDPITPHTNEHMRQVQGADKK
jgi:YHS domain-containing protein